MATDKTKLQVLFENHRAVTCVHFKYREDIGICCRGSKDRDANCSGEIQHCNEEE